MESRASIEDAAQAIDERLIAAAALPRGHREAAIAAVEPEVVSLEASVASLARPAAGSAPQQVLDDSVRAAQIRLEALASAQAELDQLDMHAAAHHATIEQIEAAQQQTRPAEQPVEQPVEQPKPLTQPPAV